MIYIDYWNKIKVSLLCSSNQVCCNFFKFPCIVFLHNEFVYYLWYLYFLFCKLTVLPVLLQNVPISIYKWMLFQHNEVPAHFNIVVHKSLDVTSKMWWIGGVIVWNSRKILLPVYLLLLYVCITFESLYAVCSIDLARHIFGWCNFEYLL